MVLIVLKAILVPLSEYFGNLLYQKNVNVIHLFCCWVFTLVLSCFFFSVIFV
jgi:hypothetical protein